LATGCLFFAVKQLMERFEPRLVSDVQKRLDEICEKSKVRVLLFFSPDWDKKG
jgi:hypothetical protein